MLNGDEARVACCGFRDFLPDYNRPGWVRPRLLVVLPGTAR